MLNHPRRQPRCSRNGCGGLLIFTSERERNPAFTACSGFQSAANGARGEVVDCGGVAAVVGARDDEVDGAAGGEEGVEAELGAAGGRAVADYDPVVFLVLLI